MSQFGEAFRLAYQVDPGWATANLTTWMVFVAGAAALANFAVVVTAFTLQDRQSHRDERLRDTQTAKLHVAALRAAKNAIEIFDVAVGGKGKVRSDFSRSDITGRMQTVRRMIDYYLQQKIVEPGVVDALITTLTLIERTILDLEQLPDEGRDRLPSALLDQLYSHRKVLRAGTEKIVDLAFQLPAGNVG